MSTSFPTNLDSFSDWIDGIDVVATTLQNSIYDCIEAIETKVGIDSSAVATSIDYKLSKFFESGRKLWIYGDDGSDVPVGWTYISGVTDCVVAVKASAGTYNVNGGNTAGTWSHGATTDHRCAHTPTTSTNGSHTHANVTGAFRDTDSQCGDTVTAGDSSHTHTINSGTADFEVNTTWRPDAAVGILIQKD
jgi:hypothetical protein